MVDTQSAAAEIKRGKKKETAGQKYNARIGASATQGGHNQRPWVAESANKVRQC